MVKGTAETGKPANAAASPTPAHRLWTLLLLQYLSLLPLSSPKAPSRRRRGRRQTQYEIGRARKAGAQRPLKVEQNLIQIDKDNQEARDCYWLANRVYIGCTGRRF